MSESGIITGAGLGIGLATTKKLLEADYSIIAITRSETKSLLLLKKKFQDKLNIHIQDLLNLEESQKLIQRILSERKITFLINNAGQRARYSLGKATNKFKMENLKINYHSPMMLSEEFLKQKKSKKILKIVSLTSIVGPRGFKDLSIYASSKGALEAGMRSLAIEFASSARVNCVAPGFVETSYAESFKKNKKRLYKWTIDNTPMKRWGKPSEIANVVKFLVSNDSSYITGTTIYVDGGWTAK